MLRFHLLHCAFALCVAALCSPACADLILTQSMTMQNAQMQAAEKKMSTAERAMNQAILEGLAETDPTAQMLLGKPLVTKTYMSQAGWRVDFGNRATLIYDAATQQVNILDRKSHTYGVESLTELESGKAPENPLYALVNSGKHDTKKAPPPALMFRAAGKAVSIAGHHAQPLVGVTQRGRGTTVQPTRLWVSTDLPTLPEVPGLKNRVLTAAALGQTPVNGIVLRMLFSIADKENGRTDVAMNTTYLSTAPLAANIFAVPAGYKKQEKEGVTPDVAPKATTLSSADTALIKACDEGDLPAAQKALAAGANVNAVNESGVNSLWLAAARGNTPLLTLLLDKGADPNQHCGTLGELALVGAAFWGQTEAVNLLLDRGANVNLTETEGKQTALTAAAGQGETATVQMLLDRGALVNAPGEQALQFAAWHGHADTVSVLLAHGAVINYLGPIEQTPLSFAAQNGHMDVVKVLLDKGANINLGRKDGTTPLMEAVLQGYPEIVKLLLKNKAAINVKNTLGQTAFSYAQRDEKTDMISLLKAAGAK